MEGDRLFYVTHTSNHHTGSLITNLDPLCRPETALDENGLKVIWKEISPVRDNY